MCPVCHILPTRRDSVESSPASKTPRAGVLGLRQVLPCRLSGLRERNGAHPAPCLSCLAKTGSPWASRTSPNRNSPFCCLGYRSPALPGKGAPCDGQGASESRSHAALQSSKLKSTSVVPREPDVCRLGDGNGCCRLSLLQDPASISSRPYLGRCISDCRPPATSTVGAQDP